MIAILYKIRKENIHMKKKTRPNNSQRKYSMFLLKLGLAPISLFLLILSAKFCEDAMTDPATALITYPDIFSVVLGSALLLIFGVIALGICEK